VRRIALACCAMVALGGLSGCESTSAKARRITAHGSRAFHQRGVSVGAVDRDVRVLKTSIVHDASGTAVVVELQNGGSRPLAEAPIALDVRDGGGRTIFRNDAAGLEQTLAHVPLLPPGRRVTWINDQVQATGTPAKALARIGAGTPAPSATPRLSVSAVRLQGDPVSGIEASGRVRNASSIEQRKLVIYAVARRAGRIVAAGRAVVPRLVAGATAAFHVFFIGNPRGAQLTVSAPPSVLK
jgi:hypothetical protein